MLRKELLFRANKKKFASSVDTIDISEIKYIYYRLLTDRANWAWIFGPGAQLSGAKVSGAQFASNRGNC